MTPTPRDAAAIALTRFGLGARPGEIDGVAADPAGWLERQIDPRGAAQPDGRFPTSSDQVTALQTYLREVRQFMPDDRPAPGGPPARADRAPTMADPAAEAAFAAQRDSRQALTEGIGQEFLARTRLATTTDAGFAERWTLFWANHFTTSASKFQAGVFIGPYEREAIRPHVFGRFDVLAQAAESHPAMLLYLDQVQSIGPNSPAGARRQSGLNENLAREILELHTVGSEAGYTQADVTEFARALTGWSVPAPADTGGQRRARGRRAALLAGEPGEHGFTFRAVVHEPGERTVMGRRYPAGGVDQGRAILRDLARQPQTARRLARRIAGHFVADDPPPGLVDRLEAAWTGSDGDLAVVARALIAAPEAWSPAATKMKTPYEFIVSTHRALGSSPQRIPGLQQPLVQMGQPPFAPPSPEGWPDTAADWAGPDALVKRLNWARTVGELAARLDPVVMAESALGSRMGARTRETVARAESRPEAITLFLMSPEFQRR